MPRFNLSWIYILAIGALIYMIYSGGDATGGINKEISYSEFKTYVQKGYTNDIVVNKTDGQVSLVVLGKHIQEVFKQNVGQTGKHPTLSARYPSPDKVDAFLDSVGYKGKVTFKEESGWLYDSYKAYKDLEDHGFDQLPAASNCVLPENMDLTVEHGVKVIAPERLKGFMMTTWMPTVSERIQKHTDAIALLKAAKEKYENGGYTR